jgi:tRNA1Val (adenine37-N6)-methyltransferase
MANSWFQFKQFTIHQDHCAMKVTTDACLFGAWVAGQLAPDSYRDGSKQPAVMHILDIGTGTGLLSLMIAQQCSTTIDAIEIDAAAAEQAKANMDASPWKERLCVIQGDAKEILATSTKQYDVIISNPPFYENELQSGNEQKNTAHHSTELSLDDLVSMIDTDFYLLLPYKRYKEIDRLFNQTDLFITQKVLVRQSVNHDYFRIMLCGQKGESNSPVIENEISIKDDKDQYTAEFINLLKDYYLYL